MVELTAGQTRYVRLAVSYALVAGPLTPTLERLPAKAQAELATLHYVGSDPRRIARAQ